MPEDEARAPLALCSFLQWRVQTRKRPPPGHEGPICCIGIMQRKGYSKWTMRRQG